MPRDAAIPLESFLSRPGSPGVPWQPQECMHSRATAHALNEMCRSSSRGDWWVAGSPDDAVDDGEIEAAGLAVLADVLQHVDDVAVAGAPEGEVPVGVDGGDLGALQEVLVPEVVGVDACPQDPGPCGACSPRS